MPEAGYFNTDLIYKLYKSAYLIVLLFSYELSQPSQQPEPSLSPHLWVLLLHF